MHLSDLALLLQFFLSLNCLIIVVANYGTTFTSVYDSPQDIDQIIRSIDGYHPELMLQTETDDPNIVEHINQRTNVWLHVDAALGGPYPFFQKEIIESSITSVKQYVTKYFDDKTIKQYTNKIPAGYVIPFENLPILPSYTFQFSNAHSIAMSGHKFLGAPVPCGLVLTLRRYLLDFTHHSNISYIGSADSTILGSRSGLNVLLMWDYLSRYSTNHHILKYWSLFNTARYCAVIFAQTIGTNVVTTSSVHNGLIKPSCINSGHLAMQNYHKNTTLVNLLQQKQQETLQQDLLTLKDNKDSTKFNQFQTTNLFLSGNDTTFHNSSEIGLVFNFHGALSIIIPQPVDIIVNRYSLSCDYMYLPTSIFQFDYDLDSELDVTDREDTKNERSNTNPRNTDRPSISRHSSYTAHNTAGLLSPVPNETTTDKDKTASTTTTATRPDSQLSPYDTLGTTHYLNAIINEPFDVKRVKSIIKKTRDGRYYQLKCAHLFAMESLSFDLIHQLAGDIRFDPYVNFIVKHMSVNKSNLSLDMMSSPLFQKD
jgi:hypothetical protein